MKTLLKSILTLFVISTTLLIAQDGPLVAGEGEKKVITSGYGKNPDEALKQALRNAVEEAVGTYMTSTTRIENDDIIEDKILSLSRGFIKDFKKLAEMKVDGETKVTVSVIVTKSQILETLKASGVKVKVAGQKMFQQFASFDSQMEDEYKLIYDLLKDLPKEGPLDYEVEVLGQPVRSGSNYEIKVRLTGTVNNNFKNQFTNFRNILNETAFDKKIVEEPFKAIKGGLFFNIRDKKELMKYSVIHSADEMKNYKNLYGEDIDEQSRMGGPTAPTFADLLKDPELALDLSRHSLDFFKKPFSPYIIGLWIHWSDISNDGYQGKIELYKYLNKKTHQFITMYMEDYFYDIGFRLVIASNNNTDLKFKIVENKEIRYGRSIQLLSSERNIIHVKEMNSYSKVIPIINESQTLGGFNGKRDESLHFLSLLQSFDFNNYPLDSWGNGKTYFAGFRPRIDGSDEYMNKIYKLALLPGTQPYSIRYEAKRKFNGKMKYKIKKDTHLNPLFETNMTLVMSSNVLKNLESIEIEPLPVELDFIPTESDLKEEEEAKRRKEAEEMQKAKRLENNHGVTKTQWFMMSASQKKEYIRRYGSKPKF